MQLRMWSYDLAREQCPTLDHLRRFCDLTRESGYNAIGLYLEHRFAYPSAPWMHGTGSATPEMVRTIIAEYPDLQIIPFVNLLGHFEGFINTEEGHQYAEEPFKGMQACASNPAFVELANKLLDDVLQIFPSQIIHIGGDETAQLGKCDACKQRVSQYEAEGKDGKAEIYAQHFAPLAQKVLDAGRTPAIWGDMFVEHPTALETIPKETIIFDWQYFKGASETAKPFIEKGHPVVTCPTLHVYNSVWLHLAQSEQNVKDNVAAALKRNAYGVCLTTWECGLFGNYETLLPAIRAAGKLISKPESCTSLGIDHLDLEASIAEYSKLTEAPAFLKSYLQHSETAEEWVRLMGIELPKVGGKIFSFSGIRSSLKCRFMLYSNPFLLWRHHHKELCGTIGSEALKVLDRAIAFAPDASYRGVSEFVTMGINFARFAEQAHLAYADGRPGDALGSLVPVRAAFEDLARNAKATHLRIGGSLADIERCMAGREHVERVMRRVKQYGDGSLGYLPAFETITHPKFVPHDQANWWLMNDWANE